MHFFFFLYLAGLKNYQIYLVFQITNFVHSFFKCLYKVKFIELKSDFISWVALTLLLICSSLSMASRCQVSSFICCLVVYLMNELNDINFHLTASFTVAHMCWYVVPLFSFTSKYFYFIWFILLFIHHSIKWFRMIQSPGVWVFCTFCLNF